MTFKFNVSGLKELDKQLKKLNGATRAKVLRSAVRSSIKPTFEIIKLSAPVGTKSHKTYKGNLVSPGFLRRSMRIVTTIEKDAAVALIGARREAFYGPQFLEVGTSKIPEYEFMRAPFERDARLIVERFRKTVRVKLEKLKK